MPEARHFAATVLHDASFRGDADTVLLLVSELVTNAVRHAATPFVLSLRVDGTAVTVGVVDEDRAHPPRMRHPLPTDTSGRGLHIVQEMSTSWGTELMAGNAKRVWFTCS